MQAAIYARISHVLDDSTIGVDRQESDGRKLVEARGWDLAAVHVDNNRSAWQRNRKRPGWDALLDDIAQGLVDVVVVAHPDRLMRQPHDLEALLDIAHKTGVQLVSAGGNRDLSNPDDVFILRIEVAHACRSSHDTSRRVSRGHQAAAALGRPGGGSGRRCFGYESDQIKVVPRERAAIQDAARRVLEGETLGSICTHLNATGVPTVTGVPWTRTPLRGILASPRTAGLREYRGEILGPAVWPALLDMPTWEAVRSVLLARTTPPGQNRRQHLLSGLVLCVDCKVPFGCRGGKPPGYACPKCHQRLARHLLDDYVERHVVEAINTPEVMEALTEPVGPEDAADRELVADCERRIEKVLDGWEQTGASAAWARKRVERIRAEQQEASRRISSRSRRSALAGVPHGITIEAFRSLPLAVRRSLVAEVFPDLTVRRGRRGMGLDESRVLLDGLQDPVQ